MRAIYLFLVLLLIFLLSPSRAQAQTGLTLSTTPIEVSGIDSVTFQIPADLDTFVYTDITFFLEGGDGGKAERNSTIGRSGDGAQVSVKFPLGRGANALRPGGLVRFVVGSRGQNTGGSGTAGGAGGGGGTAILYKDPEVSHSGGSVPTRNLSNSINYGWTLLGVAGGGGGGYVDANERSNGRPGQSDTAGSDGRSTGGNSNLGGTNGSAGADQSNDGSGAGCGYLTTGGVGNNGYNGRAGGITGRMGDDFANRSGGFGYGPGGHGRSGAGGGGGGGYSGGGSGRSSGSAASAGGGGGSFANSASTATTITQRDDNNSPDDGFISYTFTEDLTPGPAPNASCIPSLTVAVNDGGETTVTGLELDNGSTNPLVGNLSYSLCLLSFGEFTCFDERNFDCFDVGETQDWYLGVENSAERTICATPTAITIVEGTATLPTCPPDRTVDLDNGCIGTVPLQQIRPVSTGDCSDLDVNLTLPNAQMVNNPTDFFEGLYEFVAGTTVITYTNTVASCSFNVTLNAGAIPNLNCPSSRTFDASNNECGRNVNDNFTDLTNDGIGVTYRLTNEAIDFAPITGMGNLGDFYFPRGVTTVEYFLEDAGGCVSDCSFTITIEGDGEDRPVVTCANNLIVEYSPELTTQDIVDLGLLSVTDDCGISAINVPFEADLSCNRIGTSLTVSVEVFDIDGNASENCEIGFTLTETTPPTMRCREPYTITIPASGPRIVRPDQVDDGSTAECDFDLRIQGPANGIESFNCNDLGENLVTLIGTNREGNEASATCTTTITVVDDRDPTPVCQNTTLILSETGEAFLAPSNLDGGSTDNCTITDFAASKTAFTCDDLGANTITLTMTDQSGNSVNCTSMVTIQDSPTAFCAVLLPLELTAFSGETRDKINVLTWTTVREEAFSHFVVERSADATQWQDMGAVAGAGEGTEEQSEYTFTDADPLTQNYYRLRLVDLDGSYSYSDVLFLEGSGAQQPQVFPNPNNGQFKLSLPTAEAAVITVYNLAGRKWQTVDLPALSSSQVREWRNSRDLAQGVYIVSVRTKEALWSMRVVVQ